MDRVYPIDVVVDPARCFGKNSARFSVSLLSDALQVWASCASDGLQEIYVLCEVRGGADGNERNR